ncbi:MAG: hypothetical protein Q9160_006271 [Pyrenula sp. 1 TL-2023]
MGIPGILKEIGRGERISLAKFAVEFFEKHNRPLRLAIDIAIWQFQNQSGQGGANPAVRTFYFRLLRLLSLPIHPLFIYDGPQKPGVKRNRIIHGDNHQSSAANKLSRQLLQLFRFPYLTAPGEAEAECAALQKSRIVDAVMSEDVDTLMFGATTVLRDWSSEGSRGNKSPTHVSVLHADKIKAQCGLDPNGMILVALLSGGDYDTEGVPGFGPGISCEIAKAGFGKDLIKANIQGDSKAMVEWRERLHRELKENTSRFFKRKFKAANVPENFPNQTVLHYYTEPAITSSAELKHLKTSLGDKWDQDIDIASLREFTADNFDWKYKTGAKKFIRSFTPAILAHRLRRKQYLETPSFVLQVCDRRQHFDSDAMPELRLEVIPQGVVDLKMHEEQDNPGFSELDGVRQEDENIFDAEGEDIGGSYPQQTPAPPSPRKMRKSPPYDPYLPEKIWLPESIVKVGIGSMVEEWELQQREIRADPKKFATRKCPKAANGMTTQNPISNFLRVQKNTIHSTNFGTGKEMPLAHESSTAPLLPPKETPLVRSAPARYATRASRQKAPSNPPAKLDGSVNPFSMAQRSAQIPVALIHTDATAIVDKIAPETATRIISTESSSSNTFASSALSQRQEKRPRATTCEPDVEKSGARTRRKNQALKRTQTDPVLIESSPPPPIAEEMLLPSHIGNQVADAVSPFNLQKPSSIERTLGAVGSQSETTAPLAPVIGATHRPHTLAHKTVASRESLPGFYREVSPSNETSHSGSKSVLRSKAARVSLIDLT